MQLLPAIVAFLCNTLYIALSIWNNFFQKWPGICLIHHNCSVPSDANVYKDEVLTLLAVYIIIRSAVFIEFLVCIIAVKYEFHDLRNLRHGGWCPSHKQCFLLSIHMLALWNILIAIQLLTTIATPICVLLFVHPQVTVLYTIFLLMVAVSLALIVAYLLPSFPLSALGWYLRRRSQKRTENNADSETPQLMVDEQLSMHTFENSRPLLV